MPLNPDSACSQSANDSITRVKSKGDRGQPCLVPRSNEKREDRVLLVGIEALGEEYESLIQRMKDPPSPNLEITSYRNFHSTLSKAFSASRETTTSELDEWMISRRRLML